MTDIDEFDEQLKVELNKFNDMVQSLTNKDYKQKQSSFLKINQIQKNISRLLESFDLEISNLERPKANKYQSILDNHQQK
jgi:hypothetical protein